MRIPLTTSFRQSWGNFEYHYDHLLLGGVVVGIILLGISLAYILVNFSPVLAILAVLSVPMGIVLLTRPQIGLLLVVFLIPLEEINNFGPGVSTAKLLSVVVFGGAIIHFLVFRRKESLVYGAQSWLILLFLGTVILSNFTAIDPSRTLSGTVRLLRILTLYLMVIQLIRTKKDLRYLVWVFIISGTISALLGLLDPIQEGERLTGFAAGPNGFAAQLIPHFSFILCLLTLEKGLFKRVLLLLMLGIAAYGMVLTGSRGGLLGLLLSFLMFLLTQKHKLLWFVALAFLIVTGYLAMPTVIKQRVGLMEATGNEEELGNSTARRKTYQIYGFQVWQENPILGVGFDGFAEAYSRSQYRFLDKEGQKRAAHNTYLEVAVGTGLIGFIFFISLQILSLYKTWKYAGYAKLSPYLAGVSAALFAAQGGYFLAMTVGSRQYDKTLWLMIALGVVIQVLISADERQRAFQSKPNWQAPQAELLSRSSSPSI